ncbi:MAG: HlyD family secretion protein [Clostridia bacterium]|jgi:HlyD family secretion protein|nr:HlyD family secretion protein [Clostridia bacterium]
MKKKVIIAVVLLIAAALGFSLTSKPSVEVIKLESKLYKKTFVEEGKIKSVDSIDVYSKINAKALKVLVKEGVEVSKGDKIIELDTKELKNSVDALKGQLKSVEGQEKAAFKSPLESEINGKKLEIEQIEKDIKEAKDDFDKNQTIYNNGGISKEEFETIKNNLAKLENNLLQQKEALALLEERTKPTVGDKEHYEGLKESLRAEIKNLEEKINSSHIKSPITGVVSKIYAKKGENLNTVSPVFKVYSKDGYEIETYILTDKAIDVELGDDVDIIQERSDHKETFTGVITYIAPAAEEMVSSLGLKEQKVKVLVVPDEKQGIVLRPGYEVDLVFKLVEEEGIVIPKISIYDEDKIIKLNEEGMFEEIVVTKISSNETEYLVTGEGLEGINIVYKPEDVSLNSNKKYKADFKN